MPYTPPTVNYSAALDGTYTTLTGVQSVSITRGRQRFQDPFPQSNCVIELIPANSYATALAIGQYIDVRTSNSGAATCYFEGRITDVERVYGMPYNSGTGAAPADRIVITATGATGSLGATQLVNYTVPTQSVYDSMTDINTQAKATTQVDPNFSYSIFNNSYTVNNSALDTQNTLLRTAVGYMDDMGMYRTAIASVPPTYQGIYLYDTSATTFLQTNISFSDDNTATYKFNNLAYLSSVQNTFSQVTVSLQGLASQTANSGTPPYNSLIYDAASNTTANGLSLATYLYSLLSGQLTAVPYVISTDTNLSASCVDVLKVRPRSVFGVTDRQIAIGATASVKFRGLTAYGIVQGFTGNFYTDHANIQLYFSPGSVGFTLDSTAFGVLDTNRLGYP